MKLLEALTKHLGKSIVGMSPAQIFDLVKLQAQSGYDAAIFSMCIQLEIFKNEPAALAVLAARNQEKAPEQPTFFTWVFSKTDSYAKVYKSKEMQYSVTLGTVSTASTKGEKADPTFAQATPEDLVYVEKVVAGLGQYSASLGGKPFKDMVGLRQPGVFFNAFEILRDKGSAHRSHGIIELLVICAGPVCDASQVEQKLSQAAKHTNLSGSSKFMSMVGSIKRPKSLGTEKEAEALIHYNREIDLGVSRSFSSTGANDAEEDEDSFEMVDSDLASRSTADEDAQKEIVRNLLGRLGAVQDALDLNQKKVTAATTRVTSLPSSVEQIAVMHRDREEQSSVVQEKLHREEGARIDAEARLKELEEENRKLVEENARLTSELLARVAQITGSGSMIPAAPPMMPGSNGIPIPPPPMGMNGIPLPPPPMPGMNSIPLPPPPMPGMSFGGPVSGGLGGMSLAEQIAAKQLKKVAANKEEKVVGLVAELTAALKTKGGAGQSLDEIIAAQKAKDKEAKDKEIADLRSATFGTLKRGKGPRTSLPMSSSEEVQPVGSSVHILKSKIGDAGKSVDELLAEARAQKATALAAKETERQTQVFGTLRRSAKGARSSLPLDSSDVQSQSAYSLRQVDRAAVIDAVIQQRAEKQKKQQESAHELRSVKLKAPPVPKKPQHLAGRARTIHVLHSVDTTTTSSDLEETATIPALMKTGTVMKDGLITMTRRLSRNSTSDRDLVA